MKSESNITTSLGISICLLIFSIVFYFIFKKSGKAELATSYLLKYCVFLSVVVINFLMLHFAGHSGSSSYVIITNVLFIFNIMYFFILLLGIVYSDKSNNLIVKKILNPLSS